MIPIMKLRNNKSSKFRNAYLHLDAEIMERSGERCESNGSRPTFLQQVVGQKCRIFPPKDKAMQYLPPRKFRSLPFYRS